MEFATNLVTKEIGKATQDFVQAMFGHVAMQVVHGPTLRKTSRGIATIGCLTFARLGVSNKKHLS